MPDTALTALVADELDERRSQILEDWRQRVASDTSLDEASEWTLKQLHDHFPDVLEDFGRSLRALPRPSRAAGADEFAHAHAHARTRWLQGYSLRAVIREWGHFNSAMVATLSSLGTAARTSDDGAFATVRAAWSQLLTDQLAASAIEYHRLQQAEAQTRADELAAALERLQGMSIGRARVLGSMAEGLRTGLSVVMTSTSLIAGRGAEDDDHTELRNMSRASLATLERSLADLVLLARLEAGQEARILAPFDVAQRLTLLASGLEHSAAQLQSRLTWAGPDPFPVTGDAHHVGLIAQHLLLSGLRTESPGPIDLEWGDDPRNPGRWHIVVRQRVQATVEPASPPLSREIAAATDDAQQTMGVPPTGFERALQAGLIPVAARDGVNLLIAKNTCELLDASIEIEAVDGIATWRVSLPREYVGRE